MNTSADKSSTPLEDPKKFTASAWEILVAYGIGISLGLKSSRLIQLLFESSVMGAEFSRMCLPGIDKDEVESFVSIIGGKFLHSRPGYAAKRSG